MIHDYYTENLTPFKQNINDLLNSLGVNLMLADQPFMVNTAVGPDGLTISYQGGSFLATVGHHMALHELGHVLAASEDELLAPNLGLPTGEAAGSRHITPEIEAIERRAILAQCSLMRYCGSTEKSFMGTLDVASKLFKAGSVESLLEALDTPEWSHLTVLGLVRRKLKSVK